MLNLKIVSHGKNIILYGKSGTAWDNADTWVTNPIRITGSPKDFTGTFSFKITEQQDTLVVGAIPYTTMSLKDVSADYNFQYWAECVIEEEVVEVVEEVVIIPPKKDDSIADEAISAI